MKQSKCDVCGYVHAGGEPPANCPICGVGADQFSAMDALDVQPKAATASSWKCSVCGYEHSGDAPPDTCPICSVESNLFDALESDIDVAVGGNGGGLLVIIGAGIAGIMAAERARQVDPQLTIQLVSMERVLPYYRLNLTRFLAGEVSEKELQMRGRAWLEEQRVEWIEGEATAIDRAHKRVALKDGTELAYETLILTMGSHPFVPPLPGAHRGGVCTLRTLEDARRIVDRAVPGTRCVCVGGGLLGLEAAGALASRGLSVSVLEGHGWLLPRQLAEPAGRLLQTNLEGLGIKVHNHARAKDCLGAEQVTGLLLQDGSEIAAELVVIATGVRPNSYLARSCELTVGTGVIVDDRMATSDPAIFAAGDVAEHRGRLYGIWPASFSQGEVAGVNAAGGLAEFVGMAPSNSLKVLQTDIYSIGEVAFADASYSVVEEHAGDSYLRLVMRDGVLVGANLLGHAELSNPVRDAIESGRHLAEVPELERLTRV